MQAILNWIGGAVRFGKPWGASVCSLLQGLAATKPEVPLSLQSHVLCKDFLCQPPERFRTAGLLGCAEEMLTAQKTKRLNMLYAKKKTNLNLYT